MTEPTKPTEPNPTIASSDEIIAWVQYLADKLKEKRDADEATWRLNREAEKEAANNVAKQWRAIARLAKAREEQEAASKAAT